MSHTPTLRKVPVAVLLCFGLLFGSVGSAPAQAREDRLHAPGGLLLSHSAEADEAQATDWVTLGEDDQFPADDSAKYTVLPGADLTAFKARRIGDSVELRFEIAPLLETGPAPPRGVPFGFVVVWVMNTQRNSDEWYVQADADVLGERYWVTRYHGLEPDDWWEVEGEYNADESYISVFVPIRLLGGAGTVLSRCRQDRFEDNLVTGRCWGTSSSTIDIADVYLTPHPGPHQHEPPYQTTDTEGGFYGPTDHLATTRSYTIPRGRT